MRERGERGSRHSASRRVERDKKARKSCLSLESTLPLQQSSKMRHQQYSQAFLMLSFLHRLDDDYYQSCLCNAESRT